MSEYVADAATAEAAVKQYAPAAETAVTTAEAAVKQYAPAAETAVNAVVDATGNTDLENRVRAIEKWLEYHASTVEELTDVGAKAADQGHSIGSVLRAVAKQLFGLQF